jgi:hypothetical protein
MSTTCVKCQAVSEAESKFCAQCGEMLPTSLLQTTQATKQYVASATADEQQSRKGQQQWGLFETNYQRTKGISTAESMQEIEDFARTGVRPVATPGTVPWTSKTAGSSSGTGGGGGFRSGAAAADESVEAGSSSAGSATAGGGSTGVGGKFFPKGDDEGTKLFAKYQAGQKKINPTPYTGKKWSTPGTK